MFIKIWKVKKRAFTLLELIIALSLTVILMSTLMYFYRDVSTIGLETNKLVNTYFYWQYTGSRLADIIPKTLSDKTKDKDDFVFYSINDSSLTKSGSQSLVFAFDNGISLAKEFSNIVIGRLYVDKKDQLTLAYWPPDSRWKETKPRPMKKEVLKQNVKSISFEFFVPPEKSMPKKAGTSTSDLEPTSKGVWMTKPWLREYNALPAMVKMTVLPNDNQPAVIYIFPLVNGKSHIVYD